MLDSQLGRMKIAVISDVHANLPALKAVLEDADGLGVDAVYCLGDIVGYCSYPHETIDLLRRSGVESIKGNHDLIAVGELDPAGLGPNGRKAIEWTAGVLRSDEKAFLSELPDHLILDPGLLLIHSRLDDPVSHNRGLEDHVRSWEEIRSRFPHVRVVFNGHTHKSGAVRISPDGCPSLVRERRFVVEATDFYLINPGSVGHPRREDYRASYLVFDIETRRIVFRKVHYPRKHVDEANQRVGIQTDLGPSVFRHYLRTAQAQIRSVKAKVTRAL